MEGKGKLIFKMKNKPAVYKGEFKNNKFHGYGTLTRDDKVTYDGEFVYGIY